MLGFFLLIFSFSLLFPSSPSLPSFFFSFQLELGLLNHSVIIHSTLSLGSPKPFGRTNGWLVGWFVQWLEIHKSLENRNRKVGGWCRLEPKTDAN